MNHDRCDHCTFDIREGDGQEMADGALVHDDCVLPYLAQHREEATDGSGR